MAGGRAIHSLPRRYPFGDFERRRYEGNPRSLELVDEDAFDYLASRLAEKPYAAFSVEVFDCLLVPDLKSERRRACEISDRWRDRLPAGSRNIGSADIQLARQRAIEICAGGDLRIRPAEAECRYDVVGVALRLLGLPNELTASLATAELDYVAETWRADPLLLRLIEHHRSRGRRVMLLTDTWLLDHQLQDLLSRLGLKDLADEVHARGGTSASKRSGAMFKLAAEKQGVAASDILHFGPDYVADFVMPRRAGWAAQHLPTPRAEAQIRKADELLFPEARGAFA